MSTVFRPGLPGRAEVGSPGTQAASQGSRSPVGSSRALRLALAKERRAEAAVRTLLVMDGTALLVLMCLINWARFGSDWPTYPLSHYAVGFVAATCLHLGVYYFTGLYDPQQRLGAPPWLPRVARATLVAVLLDGAVALATARYLMPRGNLVVLLVAATIVLTALRHLHRKVLDRRLGPPRVLLVGPEAEAALARNHLPASDRTAVVVGQCHDTTGLVEAVERTRATDVLLLTSSLLDDVYPGTLAELELRGKHVLQRVSGAQTLLGLDGVLEVGGMPFVALRTHTLPMSRARLKRCLELALLVLSLPLTLPLTAAVAVYVRVVVGSPVLFRQERVGRDGVTFEMAKFRTMRLGAEEGLPRLADVRDPRVVPGCNVLRNTRLDELPQLWHVLRGQMSLVGPRPERPELTAQFEQLIPGYARRYEIPPGITGLAQVRGRYHTDPAYKLGHDLQYLVNWSPARDLQILLSTMWVLARQRV